MRIISKSSIKDYYDGCLAFGQDKSIVFVRNAELLDKKAAENLLLDSIRPKFSIGKKTKKLTTVEFSPLIVVFCGKIYRGIKVYRKTKKEKPNIYFDDSEKEQKVFYEVGELIEYLKQFEMKLPEDKYYSWQRDHVEGNVKAFLGAQGTDELSDYCIRNRYVSLTYAEVDPDVRNYRGGDYFGWTANGMLQPSQFYKVFDAFAAYQEIDMYVSGTLPQSTAMPIEISDKDRIVQHGFDKYSFRKAPSK